MFKSYSVIARECMCREKGGETSTGLCLEDKMKLIDCFKMEVSDFIGVGA